MENLEQKMQKQYSLNLKQIDSVKIGEREFFRFYDSQTDTIKLIENVSDSNLRDQFLDIQNSSDFAKENSGEENAKMIFDYEKKFNKHEITLVSVDSIKNNIQSYQQVYQRLSQEQKFCYDFIVKNSASLNIRYINMEEAIIVDYSNNISRFFYDKDTKKLSVEKGSVQKFENKEITVDESNYALNLDDIDFDSLVKEVNIEIPSDVPIEVSGEKITIDELKMYYDYPEMLDKQVDDNKITPKRRSIITCLLAAYNRKLQNQKEQQDNIKTYVFKPKNAAYVDAIVLFSICSFVSGILITLCVFYINWKI